MPAVSINHATLPVDDIDEAIEFYETVFGLIRAPSLKTDAPSAWFRIGNAQLHLTQRDHQAPAIHHIGITVDDFESVYDTLVERNALDTDTFGSALFILPDDTLQLYFRDPAGNFLEADAPNATALPDRITDKADSRPAPPPDHEPNIAGNPSLFLS